MADLRVLTWNVHGSARPPLAALAEVLTSRDPDVVALQEVRRGQALRLAGLLGWPRPVWARKHNPYGPLWWLAEGLGVLTHLRVAPHRPIVLTEASRRHHTRRIALPVEVEIERDGSRFLLVNAHLSSGDLASARLAEATGLASVLPAGMVAVVAGDLNDRPGTAPLEAFEAAGLLDAWAAAGGCPSGGLTSPANAPVRRIDYVLVRGAHVLEAEVLHDLGPAMSGLSDHRPVLAVVRVT